MKHDKYNNNLKAHIFVALKYLVFSEITTEECILNLQYENKTAWLIYDVCRDEQGRGCRGENAFWESFMLLHDKAGYLFH